MTDLAKFRELLAAATLGPWEQEQEDGVSKCGDLVLSKEAVVADCLSDEILFVTAQANAALIVAAVNALPGLIDELEIHRAGARPCVCPTAANTPHVHGCDHPLAVLKERDALRYELNLTDAAVERLRKQVDELLDSAGVS